MIFNFKIKDIHKHMELIEAVRGDDLDRVNQLLLNPRVNVNTNVGPGGSTPLLIAASHGNVEIGRRLIQAKADINQTDILGMTPLLIAVTTSHKDFVVLLLEQKDAGVPLNIDVKAYDDEEFGDTALTRAITSANPDVNLDIIEMLLGSGANPDISNVADRPLGLAIDKPEIVKLLLEHGADPNYKMASIGGLTPLMRAARSTANRPVYIDIIRLLVKVPNIELDATSNTGLTALMIAAPSALPVPRTNYVEGNKRRSEIVRILLEAGADPLLKSMSIRDREGRTARQFIKDQTTPGYKLLQDAEAIWLAEEAKAQRELQEKFMIARRLRMGVDTSEGSRLELPQRQLAEGIIRNSEYSNLCMGLQTNLNKPGVIALAKSLNIKTSGQTKTQLCVTIAKRLIIK